MSFCTTTCFQKLYESLHFIQSYGIRNRLRVIIIKVFQLTWIIFFSDIGNLKIEWTRCQANFSGWQPVRHPVPQTNQFKRITLATDLINPVSVIKKIISTWTLLNMSTGIILPEESCVIWQPSCHYFKQFVPTFSAG